MAARDDWVDRFSDDEYALIRELTQVHDPYLLPLVDRELGTRPLSQQEVAALTDVLLAEYIATRDESGEPQGRGATAYEMIVRLPKIGQRWRRVDQ